MSDSGTSDVTALTVQLLTAYFANNAVPPENLAELVRATRSALLGEQGPIAIGALTTPETQPATIDDGLSSPDAVAPTSAGNAKSTSQRARPVKPAPVPIPADVEAVSEARARAVPDAKRQRRMARATPVATKSDRDPADASPAQPAKQPNEPKSKAATTEGQTKGRPKLKLFGTRSQPDAAKREEANATGAAPVRSKYLRTS